MDATETQTSLIRVRELALAAETAIRELEDELSYLYREAEGLSGDLLESLAEASDEVEGLNLDIVLDLFRSEEDK